MVETTKGNCEENDSLSVFELYTEPPFYCTIMKSQSTEVKIHWHIHLFQFVNELTLTTQQNRVLSGLQSICHV